MELSFHIHYHCLYGDSVFVCGNIEEFGNWDPKKAFRLEWTPFDNWKGKITLPISKYESIQYKYIADCTNTNFFSPNFRWEQINNRSLVLKKESLTNINEVWDYKEFTRIERIHEAEAPPEKIEILQKNIDSSYKNEEVFKKEEVEKFQKQELPQKSISQIHEAEAPPKKIEISQKNIDSYYKNEELFKKEVEEFKKQEDIKLKVIQDVLAKELPQIAISQLLPNKQCEESVLKTVTPIFSNTLKIMENVQPNKKENVLKQILTSLEEAPKSIPPPPLPNSIIMEKNNKEVFQTLKENSVPVQFLETTESSEMKEIFKQIEKITGCDLTTGSQTEMIKLKIDSPDLNKSKIVQNNEQQIREALIQDIANAYGISKDKVFIRHIVPGSIEVLLSIPEVNKNQTLNSSNLNSISDLLKKNGISNINTSQKPVTPDIKKAKEILENYTRPVIIETKENGSILMEKFGKHIHLLATLSSKVRVVHNPRTNSLEIHGSPSAKNEVLAYLASLEDQLQNIDNSQVVIIPQDPAQLTQGYFTHLFNFLYEEAKNFVLTTYVNRNHALQTNTIQKNFYLENGSPSAKSFIAAIQKMNLNLSSPQNIFSIGKFGWHGTGNDQNLLNILYANLDPRKRIGQACGPGEYCAIDPSYSQTSYWGSTQTLMLFFILEKNNPFYTLNYHYVINNPSQNEMYMIPILIATFNNRNPPIQLNIQNNQQEEKNSFSWEWSDDSGWTPYGKGQINLLSIQKTIEEMHKKYKNGQSGSCFTLRFVRLNNNKEDDYKIDFTSMLQTNIRTNYIRNIRRNNQ